MFRREWLRDQAMQHEALKLPSERKPAAMCAQPHRIATKTAPIPTVNGNDVETSDNISTKLENVPKGCRRKLTLEPSNGWFFEA